MSATIMSMVILMEISMYLLLLDVINYIINFSMKSDEQS